ncbi:MAG: right-handed parallel beta-helix repeat-containing protein [Thermodesulfobacteriota bacterium]|nr:right-handed parallel beta-helix repeat-containing protein [Thermodesulfobacteriota bacterium]
MQEWKKLSLVMALVVFAPYLIVGAATAATVKVQTSTGAGASATYYTQSGDSATGQARVSSNGSVNLTTEGSVEMGLVRGGSGPDNGSFAPFTGDFSASASSSGGASASSSNPRVDIFVVTDLAVPANSTVGNYTIDGAPGTTYGSIGLATTAAGGEANSRPDWILVDQGTYDESVRIDDEAAGWDIEDNSALTSAWGAADTTINGNTPGTGWAIGIRGVDNFLVEGFTVTSTGNRTGILPRRSDGVEIRCNDINNNNEHGIEVIDSENALITHNTVSDNQRIGIAVDNNSHGAQIADNTVFDNQRRGIGVRDSDDVQITNNTVSNNLDDGISVWDSDGADITGNTVSGNTWDGIFLNRSDNSRISNNSSTGNVDGIFLWDSDGADITGNTVSGNTRHGIFLNSSDNSRISNNSSTGNAVHGILLGGSDGADITGNTVSGNARDGISAQYSMAAEVTGNTVSGNAHDGIFLDNSDNSRISNNTVSNGGDDGIDVNDSNDAQITSNTVSNNADDGIDLEDSNNVQITNNTVSNSGENGIDVDNSVGFTITSNIITRNGASAPGHGGIYLWVGSDGAEIHGNNIQGNQSFGLWNDTLNDVDAEDNWWGQAGGPTYEGNLGGGNPGTVGNDIWDAVAGPFDTTGNGVDYQPFATTPFSLP